MTIRRPRISTSPALMAPLLLTAVLLLLARTAAAARVALPAAAILRDVEPTPPPPPPPPPPLPSPAPAPAPAPQPAPAPPPAPSPPDSSPAPPAPNVPECIWLDYDRNPNLTSYEFQMQPHRGRVWHFERAARALEALMRRLTKESERARAAAAAAASSAAAGSATTGSAGGRQWPTAPANFTLVEGSRWDTVLREHAFAVSSRKGRPLHPSRWPGGAPSKRHPFPWKRLAYLRLRRYVISLPPGAPGAPPPGTADLALKMKKVDPRLGPRQPGVELAGGARAKLEADVHCDHQRASVSPLFAPVPASLNVSRVGDVAAYFPNLAELARLDPDEPLPFCHAVWRRKATWTVVYRGLVGEVGLVAKFNSTLGDAVAGRRVKNGEVSLRIRREVAAASREGESEEERLGALYEAMDALAAVAQRFRDAGWDGKSPGLLPPPASPAPAPSPAPSPAPAPAEGEAPVWRRGLEEAEQDDDDEASCARAVDDDEPEEEED